MERLYYEKTIDPNQPKAFNGEKQGIDDYLNKVARLVPSEIIAGYLAVIGIIESAKNANSERILVLLTLIICTILTPIYLNKVANPEKPKRNHLILSTIAFLVWAYVTTGKQIIKAISPNDTEIFDPVIASAIMILFSLISAAIPLNK